MPPKSDTFVPQMDAKALKTFSRNGKCKGNTQTSEPIPTNKVITIDGDTEVTSSTISDKLQQKKVCTEKNNSATSIQQIKVAENQPPSSSTKPPSNLTMVSKWWHWFQGYEGKVRIGKIGLGNTTKMVQTFNIQNAFLGHALESGIGMLEKELKEKSQKLKDQDDELARTREATTELEMLQGKFHNLFLEKDKLQTDFTSLQKDKDKSDLLLEQQTNALKST
ncbi:hydrophobic/amphiphilic exporter-1, HAE1 family [Sesbania bispinosa]|nr:hydrophobic/amphiphilic exporter-1, HAE1 family [Sesbania bispinosa]